VKTVTHFPNGEPPVIETTVNTVQASDLPIRNIDWLWVGYLALRKLHILCGRPGCGKTTIALKLSAAITIGEGWPDGSKSKPGNVVVWSGEDDPTDTLIPRLILSGAKIDRVYFVRGTTDIDGNREFDPSTDIEPLQREIRRIGNVGLLIIDPLVSIVRGDDHKNGIVRRSIQPLSDLATAEDIAVLGITHFSKNSIGKDPVERVTGSLAYGAAARIVLVAIKNEEADTRVFCRAKSNIGTDGGGFEYEIKQSPLADRPEITASYVEWGKAVEGEARDILAQAEGTDADSNGGGALGEAMRFLLDALKDGAESASVVKQDAESAGINEKTLSRARKAMGVKASKAGMKGGWEWSLPATQTAEEGQATSKKDSKIYCPSSGNLSFFEAESQQSDETATANEIG
jgi:putative DNA primase/helicase